MGRLIWPRILLLSAVVTLQIPSLASTVRPVLASDVAFASTVNLSSNAGASQSPEIAAIGSSVYVVWEDSLPGNPEVLFRASNNNGTSFGSTINLSNNAGNSANAEIAAVGSNVYVVWQDDTTGNSDVLFRASNDNGASFGATANLSNNALESTVPQIAVSGTNVYVTWENEVRIGPNLIPDVFFKISTNSGASFGAIVNLSNNLGFSREPRIVAAGTSLYVAWLDDTSTVPARIDDVFFKASTDGGATFGTTINLSQNSGSPLAEQIAAAGNSVYVAWADDTPDPNFDILVRASTSNGASFGTTTNLSMNAGFSLEEKIAAAGTNVYVVWNDGTGSPLGSSEIFLKTSSNNGATFSGNVNLSSNAGKSSVPKVAATGLDVYVAWQDDTAGSNDILFRSSNDNGASFGATVNLSSNAGVSLGPALAANGDRIYAVWQDDTPGNDEILFRVGGAHDVAVTDVSLSLQAGDTHGSIGTNLPVLVTVTNLGNQIENVTVTLFLNSTLISSRPGITLAPGASLTEQFTWNNSGLSCGNYILRAEVSPVPGETNLANNSKQAPFITLRIAGDIDGDRDVDILDASILAFGFGSLPGQPRWNSNADLDNDNDIDILDASNMAFHFGQVC